MATLVEASRAHNTTTTRPRAVVPIVPVIPRSLQIKRKAQPVLKPLTIQDSSKDAASSSKQPIEQEGGAPPVLGGSNGNLEARRHVNTGQTMGNVGNGTLTSLEIATDGKFSIFRVLTLRSKAFLHCLFRFSTIQS